VHLSLPMVELPAPHETFVYVTSWECSKSRALKIQQFSHTMTSMELSAILDENLISKLYESNTEMRETRHMSAWFCLAQWRIIVGRAL
jgi:hypothetical protein